MDLARTASNSATAWRILPSSMSSSLMDAGGRASASLLPGVVG
ncbi:MAG: hypothetical protein ACREJO_00610 [Phycisphaerales bacterium]